MPEQANAGPSLRDAISASVSRKQKIYVNQVHFGKHLFTLWEQLFRFLATFGNVSSFSEAASTKFTGTIYKGLLVTFIEVFVPFLELLSKIY